MKILLLGSEGMLGSELFSMLKLDHEVVGKGIQNRDLCKTPLIVIPAKETVS